MWIKLPWVCGKAGRKKNTESVGKWEEVLSKRLQIKIGWENEKKNKNCNRPKMAKAQKYRATINELS